MSAGARIESHVREQAEEVHMVVLSAVSPFVATLCVLEFHDRLFAAGGKDERRESVPDWVNSPILPMHSSVVIAREWGKMVWGEGPGDFLPSQMVVLQESCGSELGKDGHGAVQVVDVLGLLVR